MTYVIDNTASTALFEPAVAPAKAGQGFFRRLVAAMVESRRRSALRELRAYSYRLKEVQLGEDAAKGTADLPFRG